MKEPKRVSKAVFLNTVFCPSLGWLYRSGEATAELPELAAGIADELRMDQGREIGRRAREAHRGGVLIDEGNLAASAKKTVSFLADNSCKSIFEGTFLVDNYVSKADVLLRRKGGWHLIEVKSSVNDKPELVDDLAYTAMVMMQAGVDIVSASLMLIDRDYRLGMSNDALFVESDHTDDGLLRAAEFSRYWDEVQRLSSATKMPKPELGLECKKCPLFFRCVGRGIDNHILEIPRLSAKRFEGLRALGAQRIEDIPVDFELTEKQARVRTSVVTGKPWASKTLEPALASIAWPAFYLDFETMMTAIPLYPNMAPYTQIPTQYSIHKCSGVGHIMTHKEYLSDHSQDSRRHFAENLIRDLENSGSIITYSTFERTTINALALLYPDLSRSLGRLTERIVDLEAIVRRNFYHPDFHGSTSIKSTLPALVPGMSYDDLELQDGDSASAAFAYLALGRSVKKSEIDGVRRNLLQYCERDTLAMVKLHESLHSYL